MNCIICGKELTGKRRKYCSKKCAQIGYITGKAETKIDRSKEAEVLFIRFQKAFNHYGGYKGNGNGFIRRIFIAACVMSGFCDSSIAKAIKRDRSTVCVHRNHLSDLEKKIAKEFLENKNYVYGSKYNNFSYGVKNDTKF